MKQCYSWYFTGHPPEDPDREQTDPLLRRPASLREDSRKNDGGKDECFSHCFYTIKARFFCLQKKPGSNCSSNSYSRLDLSYEIPYTIRLPRATRAWRRRWATGRRRPPMSITRWYCLWLNNIWKRLTLTLLVVRSEAYWWIGRVCWLAYCTVYKINWIQINLLQISISECLLYQFVSWSLLFIIFFLYFLLLTLLFLPSKKLREHLAHQFNLNWSLSFMF